MSKVTARPGSSAEKVLRVAAREVGYHEGRNSSGWNNKQKYSPAVPGLEWSNFMAWCATFVSWVAMKAGFAKLYPRTASTDTGAAWWQAQGRWSEYPAIGAQGYLAHGRDEYHTFLVEAHDDTYVYTIEGNTNDNGSSQGDGVYRLRRLRRSSSIEGYGVPKFTDGVQSADPRLNHKPSGKPVKKPAKVKLQTPRERAAALIRLQRAGVKRPAVIKLLNAAARATASGAVK